MTKELIKSQLFKGLSEREIDLILENTHYNISNYDDGDLISLSGENLNSLMMIIDGGVRGEMLDATGKAFRVEDLDKNRILAPGFLFGDTNMIPVNIIASEPTKILFIPKDSFFEVLSKNQIILKNYLDILSNKTQFLALKIKNVFLQSIEGKIANYLLTLSSKNNSQNFEMDKSQTWLAERFSVARPSVARVFSKMKSKGIIECKGKHVRIIKMENLKKCVNEV